jgi:hypothetical protein
METKNKYSRTNVNVGQGPRTGNSGAHDGKRGAFKAAKAEREPLARSIMKAFGDRAQDDKVNSKLEGIDSDVKPKKFKR